MRRERFCSAAGASIAALLFPPTGIPALLASLKAGRLAKQGRIEEARLAGERARDWCWYSVGIGLAVYFVLFLVVLFTIRDGILREVYFERTQRERHRASPLYADGHIYLTARSGIVTVVKAGRKFEIVQENELHEAISASPVISNGVLYLRSFDRLWAFGNPVRTSRRAGE